jgi:hypothetical protein
LTCKRASGSSARGCGCVRRCTIWPLAPYTSRLGNFKGWVELYSITSSNLVSATCMHSLNAPTLYTTALESTERCHLAHSTTLPQDVWVFSIARIIVLISLICSVNTPVHCRISRRRTGAPLQPNHKKVTTSNLRGVSKESYTSTESGTSLFAHGAQVTPSGRPLGGAHV